MVTINDINGRVRNLVKDNDKVRWSDSELIDWVNDAQAEIARQVTSAYPKRAIKQLVAGTRQSLSDLGITDGYAILDVVSNVTQSGDYGKAITQVDRAILDAQYPMWASVKGSEVSNWSRNPASSTEFYIYPSLRDAGGKVEVIYAAVPPKLNLIADEIALYDIYAVAIGYYVAFRVYSKDFESSANQTIAAGYLNLFNQFVKGT